MLKTIQGWWRREEGCQQAPDLMLAVTRLMVVMMGIDGKLDQQEYQEISDLISEQFDLSSEKSMELIAQAMDTGRRDLEVQYVVKSIRENYTVAERAAVLAKLWRVAIADGDIDFLEEQYMNRVSLLIGVPSEDLAELKEKEEKQFPELNRV